MRTLLMLPLLLLPFTAQAASLLPGGDYPAPDCRSPLRPLPGDSPMDWRMYRSDMEAYRQCVSRHCPARCGAYPQTDGKSRARVQ